MGRLFLIFSVLTFSAGVFAAGSAGGTSGDMPTQSTPRTQLRHPASPIALCRPGAQAAKLLKTHLYPPDHILAGSCMLWPVETAKLTGEYWRALALAQ